MAAVQRGYAKEIIAKRLSEEGRMEEKQDFMYHILRQTEEKGMTREELEANAGLLVLAGTLISFPFLPTLEFLYFQLLNFQKSLLPLVSSTHSAH